MPNKPQVHRPPGHAAAQRATDRARRERMPNRDALYGRRWKKAARLFLLEHPLCECADCRASGHPLPAEAVDHIVPHRGDPAKFWDASNWCAMAKPCHDAKTGRGL